LSKDGQDEHKLAKSSAAVLCTDAKTFLLRQVQSSNSVHILQPSDQVGVDGLSTVRGATAIAQCGTIVELAPSSDSALDILKDILPPWSQNGIIPNHRKWNKRTVFSDLPFSNGELQRAWTESFAFERDGCSWIPSAWDILDIWNALLVTAKAGIVNLDEPFSADVVWEIIRDGGTQFPREMFQAFIERFTAYNDFSEYMVMDGITNRCT
jgi:sister chromatid cohesion protein DCC1